MFQKYWQQIVPIIFDGNSPEKKLVLTSAFQMPAVPIGFLLQSFD